jgi:hypothetical protein
MISAVLDKMAILQDRDYGTTRVGPVNSDSILSLGNFNEIRFKVTGIVSDVILLDHPNGNKLKLPIECPW